MTNSTNNEALATSWTPVAVWREAIQRVPQLRFALAVAGIISLIAIVKSFGVDLRVAVFGTVVMLVLMTAVVVFAWLAKASPKLFAVPILVFVWFSIVITICSAASLFGSVFFRWPVDLQNWLTGKSAQSTIAVTLTYSGEVKAMKGKLPLDPFSAVLNLTLEGSTVTGQYNNTTGDEGLVSGQVSGDYLDLKLASSRVGGGTCDLQGSLKFERTRFEAVYSCPDGEHGKVKLGRVNTK